jgi:hypothetical protein
VHGPDVEIFRAAGVWFSEKVAKYLRKSEVIFQSGFGMRLFLHLNRK